MKQKSFFFLTTAFVRLITIFHPSNLLGGHHRWRAVHAGDVPHFPRWRPTVVFVVDDSLSVSSVER